MKSIGGVAKHICVRRTHPSKTENLTPISTLFMPSIEYEGRTYVLKTIKKKCLKCGTFCETSNPYPDMAKCSCGHVSVDGGISAGATVNGNPWAMEDYSIYRAENRPETELSQDVITQHHNQRRQGMIESYRRQGVSEERLKQIMSGC
jgi:hypothetical protein